MRGTHREPSGSVLPVIAVVVVLAAVGTALFFLFRSGLTGPPGEPSPTVPVPEFSFRIVRAKPVPVGKRPSRERVDQAVEDVHAVLDRLYVAGFVDPAQWSNGFPEALGTFAQQARDQASVHLDELTLGPAARSLEAVNPDEGELTVSVLFDRRRRPVAAVALASFAATGQVRGGTTIPIEHHGRYVLRPFEGGWAIVGYDVSGSIGDAGSPEPTATPEEEAS